MLDLRQCSYVGADLRAKVLSGALMANANFSGANMQVRLRHDFTVQYFSAFVLHHTLRSRVALPAPLLFTWYERHLECKQLWHVWICRQRA